MPDFDGLFGACFEFAGTVLVSFGIAIGLWAWAVFGDQSGLGPFILVATVLGCLYFPMAFLAVAMKDSVAAANPLVVIPAILKVPLPYLVTAAMMMGVFGLREVGDLVMRGMQVVGYTTKDMSTLFLTFGVRSAWSFFSVYLLTVNMRVIGNLYVTNKHKLGWFSR